MTGTAETKPLTPKFTHFTRWCSTCAKNRVHSIVETDAKHGVKGHKDTLKIVSGCPTCARTVVDFLSEKEVKAARKDNTLRKEG